jgi:pullulanase
VGNEVATERPQVRKFVLDSVKYWMQQYHIDGFRFDLMAILGKNTMSQVSTSLHAINPHTILLGEPWGSSSSGIVNDTQLTEGQQKGMHVAVFNDKIRDGIFGNTGDPKAQGYATGDPTSLLAVAKGLTGSIDYSPTMQGFTASPEETINYVTCHDNMTLWDKIHSSNPGIDENTAINMDELSQSIVMLSQGVPFMQGGEEFLRTKGGNGNSYNAGDAVNQFDWARKSQYSRVFDYYAGLIHLRQAHPAFRMTSAADIKSHLRFLAAKNYVIQMELTGNANGDSWQNIDVIFNPNKDAQTVTLPGGTWTIVGADGKMGTDSLGTATGTFQVSGYTAAVLYGGDVGTAVDPSAAGGSKASVAVTFNVKVPSNTPSSDTVFISGSIDQLGPWDAGKQPMKKAGDNLWTVTLQIPDGTHLQYKYTRGTWATVENWGTITGLVNRNVVIDGGDSHTQTVNDTATDWGQPGPDDHRAVQKWTDLPLP